MHPKMLGSGKSEIFVAIHDQERRMGSFGQEKVGSTRRTCGRIVAEGEFYHIISGRLLDCACAYSKFVFCYLAPVDA